MARKTSKSSTRRSRQRRRQRPPIRPAIPQPRPQADEDASATVAEAAPERPRPTPPSSRPGPRTTASRNQVAGPSRLTERAIAEYHYVQRDLRNIAVLVVIMAVTLAAAALIVNLVGIGQV